MIAAATETTRLTSDPYPPDELRADVARLFDALAEGGIGLVPLDVAYAVIATTPSGIRRIFEVKRRSYEKPSGMFGNWRMSRDIHLMDDQRHAMVREFIEQERSRSRSWRRFAPTIRCLPRSILSCCKTPRRAARWTCCSMPANSTTRSRKARSPAGSRCSAPRRICRSPAASTATRTSTSRSAMPRPSISTTANRNTRTRMGSPAPSSIYAISPSIRVGHCFDRLKKAFATRFGITLED